MCQAPWVLEALMRRQPHLLSPWEQRRLGSRESHPFVTLAPARPLRVWETLNHVWPQGQSGEERSVLAPAVRASVHFFLTEGLWVA